MSIFGRWRGQTLSQIDGKKITRHFVPYTVLVAALFAMTFFGVCVPDFGPRGPRGPAASVAGEDISRREFARYWRQFQNNPDSQSANMASQIIQYLVSMRVGYMISLDLGIRASHEEVLEHIRNLQAFHDDSGTFDSKLFRNYLDYNSYTEELFFEDVRRELSIMKMQGLVRQTYFSPRSIIHLRSVLTKSEIEAAFIEINPENVKLLITKQDVTAFMDSDKGKTLLENHYTANKHKYPGVERRKIQKILLNYKGARNAIGVERSKAQSQSLAQTLSKQILAKTHSMESLQKHSAHKSANTANATQDTSTTNDGHEWVEEDSLGPPKLAEKVFAAKEGQLIELESPFGFHLVMVTDILTKEETTFETAKFAVAEKILRQEKQKEAAASIAMEAHSWHKNEAVSAQEKQKHLDSLRARHPLSWKTIKFSTVAESPQDIEGGSSIMFRILETLANNKDWQKQEKKAEILLDTPLLAGSNWYIFKLVDFSSISTEGLMPPAEYARLDELQKQIQEYMSNLRAGRFMEQLMSLYLRDLENANLIQTNPDYIDLNGTP